MKDYHFHTTHWTAVLAVKEGGENAKDALRELCDTYYAPVLCYIERAIQGAAIRVYGPRDARDLTHDFFAQVLEGDMFETLQREGGRFRSYLLGAVKHFLAHVREKETRTKRGGAVEHVALVHEEIAGKENEDANFDRDWARNMLHHAYDSLGNSIETKTLLPWITCELDAENRNRIAEKLAMSDVAVKVALHRLRKRFRETIRKSIAATVEHPSEIDGELDYLVRTLRNTNGNDHHE